MAISDLCKRSDEGGLIAVQRFGTGPSGSIGRSKLAYSLLNYYDIAQGSNFDKV
jgi:hypothetical protein